MVQLPTAVEDPTNFLKCSGVNQPTNGYRMAGAAISHEHCKAGGWRNKRASLEIQRSRHAGKARWRCNKRTWWRALMDGLEAVGSIGETRGARHHRVGEGKRHFLGLRSQY